MTDIERLKIRKKLLEENCNIVKEQCSKKLEKYEQDLAIAEENLTEYIDSYEHNSKKESILNACEHLRWVNQKMTDAKTRKESESFELEISNYLQVLPNDIVEIVGNVMLLENKVDVAFSKLSTLRNTMNNRIDGYRKESELISDEIESIELTASRKENLEFFLEFHTSELNFLTSVLEELESQIQYFDDHLELKKNVISDLNIKILNRLEKNRKGFEKNLNNKKSEQYLKSLKEMNDQYVERNSLPDQTKSYVVERGALLDLKYITLETMKHHLGKIFKCKISLINMDDSLNINQKSLAKMKLKEEYRKKQYKKLI